MSIEGMVAALFGVDDQEELRGLSDQVEGIARAFPAPARLGLRAGADILDGLSRLLTGRRLGDLDPAAREAVCAVIAARPLGARLVETLKLPVLLAAGTGRLGERLAPEVAAARPDAELDCVPSSEWPACTTADAVVIGSGAGGAMGSTVAFGRPPVLVATARGVGGTTLVNCGTSYRTPDRVLGRWADEGVDGDRFRELLDEVERTIEVARQPLDVIGRNGLLVLEGARKLGWRAAPLRRNAPGCDGCCQCVAGCPENAKNGVHLNALPQACASGARIVTHGWAERILHERGRATGVRVRRPDGSALEVLAPLVLVAAGATQTPPLLSRSGLGGHPGLGRGMAVHPATSLAGRFDEPVVSWSGVLQSVGVEELHDQGILIEATASPPGMSSFVLPGVGRALRAELDRADHLAVIGAMVADAPSGRVYGRRRPVIRYDLAEADAAKVRRAMVAMGRILFAAGAREVLTGHARHPVARTVKELAEFVADLPAAEMHLAAFHPTGTVRLGRDPRRAPAAPDGRLRGADGIYIADASVLPTCPEVNPQLSIMAMALAVTEAAVRRPSPS